ncbi:MAG: universal stress protein [Candidatus Thiodiazotropha endolucinida]
MNPKRILCASHGTDGARAAEEQALRLCHNDVALHHLIVVPEFWKGMMGDDWLNNAVTRERFGNYLEGQLDSEVAEVVERLDRAAQENGAEFSCESRFGKPAECLVDASRGRAFDLVVIGSPRPKGMHGLRSRMDIGTLVRELRIPLLIVPHPGS